MSVKTKFRFLFLALVLAAVFFTTCDSPMGMGDSIDWEPPVLKLDPTPNPLYVRNGTILTGTATDNVKVDRVVMTNSITGQILATAVLNGENFKIVLDFDEKQNGEKITARIDAYDTAGRNDSRSSAFVSLIIDIKEPIIEKKYIQRTSTQIANLSNTVRELVDLVNSDPDCEKKDNTYKYQNGWFRLEAETTDKDSQVEIVSLKIYDAYKDINYPLLDIKPNEDSSKNYPKWDIKEEAIINKGAIKWGSSYYDEYYKNNKSYYYRVTITAVDKSSNVEEDEGYICLRAKSDDPKGVFDTTVCVRDNAVSKGTPLPIDFYDDDMLAWAFAGLFTKAQWEGTNLVGPTDKIPVGSGTNEQILQQKMEWIKEKLTNLTGDTIDGYNKAFAPSIYNWRYDKYNKEVSDDSKFTYKALNVDERLVYVPTGQLNDDYGDFVLFVIMADKKTFLNGGTGPESTNTNNWRYKKWDLSIVDENLPLIVFDTTAPVNSPEENTFPKLTDGEYFTISGYTLRDAGASPSFPNKVTTFRMAWIPAALADTQLEGVKDALKVGPPYPVSDIRYYDDVDFEPLGNMDKDGKSRIQKFSKKLSVLKDFNYNGKLENATKLFVFYAKDTMQNEVYRELRLLGSSDAPVITVYDATNNIDNSVLDTVGLPDPNLYVDTNKGGLLDTYYNPALKNANDTAYSKIQSGVGNLKNIPVSESFITYPRGTIVKYWLKVKETGVVAIDSIKMEDITYPGNPQPVGHANTTGKLTDFNGDEYYSLSFCEYYPDVTQRTFLFTVTDKLGNPARVQRTIAITNAAQLDSITTTKQSATYGAGTTITLQANFSGQIYLTNANMVYLNVIYEVNGSPKFKALPAKSIPNASSPQLSLDFDFVVPLNATGQLKTVNAGYTGSVSLIASEADDPSTLLADKVIPLYLNGNSVYDRLRGAEAFIPGVTTVGISVPNWPDDNNNRSLQPKKEILLDGKKPIITNASVSGKAPYSGSNYYFNGTETIQLTLSTDASSGKEISVKGTPKLSYKIKQSGGTPTSVKTTSFVYSRPDGAKSLVFTLPVSSSEVDVDGEIVDVTLITNDLNNTIIDNYDNPADTTLTNLIPSGTRIFVKKTKPLAPNVTITGITGGFTDFGTNPATTKYLNQEPTITINASSSPYKDPPNADIVWETPQYSIDNGVTWTSNNNFTLTNGFNNTAQVRYIDIAGNEGAVRSQKVQVNTGFPKLIAVSATQANGWYKKGTNLEFNLSFDAPVNVNSGVSITLTNVGQVYNSTNPDTYSYQKVLTPDAGTNINTVKFKWDNITGKEMQAGLYISRIDLSGLSDTFNNKGGTGTRATTVTTGDNVITINPLSGSSYTCTNLPYGGIKVDAVNPTVNTWNPAKGIATGNDVVSNIVLTFSEKVMKGSGVITIRPRGSYAIPPVLEDTGYYLEVATGERKSSSGSGRTYISSFYDIYNTSGLSPTERGYLTKGSSMSDPDMNARTGQSAGPYKKTTHGLIEGPGYSGNYSSTDGANAPNLKQLKSGSTNVYENVYTAMIPDISTKWVLDYQYLIDDKENDSAVSRIRGVLNKVKWRWQEIDVVNVTGEDSTTITIPLNEPLLKGLEWDVYYPEGTFTDTAGNPATGSGSFTNGVPNGTNSDYYFTTPGIQAPVIRVNRRSYDGRNSNWSTAPASSSTNGAGTYTEPGATTTGWASNTAKVSDNGATNDGGWGINDFNNVHFRVETESPSSIIDKIEVKYHKGSYSEKTGARGGWGGDDVGTTNGDSSKSVSWNAAAGNIAGTWVLPNIIRRSGNNASTSYTIITKNNTKEVRTFTNVYRGFRSYNRDLTKDDLDFDSSLLTTISLSNTTSTTDNSRNQGVITGFNALDSSKSYIVARVTKKNESTITATGYEGVFRTVIALNYANSDTAGRPTNNNLFIEGSNIKNGMPSVAGFPVRDAEETGNGRFVKRLCKLSSDTSQFYWVSTEIVCEWYCLVWGGGGSHQAVGEVNNYITVGYGDLTFGYAITRSGM